MTFPPWEYQVAWIFFSVDHQHHCLETRAVQHWLALNHRWKYAVKEWARDIIRWSFQYVFWNWIQFITTCKNTTSRPHIYRCSIELSAKKNVRWPIPLNILWSIRVERISKLMPFWETFTIIIIRIVVWINMLVIYCTYQRVTTSAE